MNSFESKEKLPMSATVKCMTVKVGHSVCTAEDCFWDAVASHQSHTSSLVQERTIHVLAVRHIDVKVAT